MTSGDKIAEALFDALTSNGDSSALYVEVSAFKKKYPNTYNQIKKQPFARKLLEAIEEAMRYENDMNGVDNNEDTAGNLPFVER